MHAFYIQSWIYVVNEITAQKKKVVAETIFLRFKKIDKMLCSVLRLEKKKIKEIT